MTRIKLIVLLALAAGPAYGTFELQDPAAQTMEELENERKSASQAAPPQETQSFTGKNQAVTGTVHTSVNIGGTTCSDFVFYRQARSQWYWPSLYWLQGFIDGAGYRQPASPGKAPDPADPEAIADWVTSYCRENSSVRLAQAAGAYLDSN